LHVGRPVRKLIALKYCDCARKQGCWNSCANSSWFLWSHWSGVMSYGSGPPVHIHCRWAWREFHNLPGIGYGISTNIWIKTQQFEQKHNPTWFNTKSVSVVLLGTLQPTLDRFLYENHVTISWIPFKSNDDNFISIKYWFPSALARAISHI